MGYADLSSMPTPKDQRALETIINKIVIARDRAKEHLMDLSSLADQIFGPTPQAQPEVNVVNPPHALVDVIHDELQHLENIQADISSQIARLHNL